MFEGEKLDELLNVVDLLVRDTDKFKQRAAAEFLAGLLRGGPHNLYALIIFHLNF